MSQHTSPFTTRAHAKLNLALAVGAAADAPDSPYDGYHPICSYMHAIELGDQVRIERLGSAEPSRFDLAWAHADGGTSPVGWALEQDLVYRAHGALERHIGEPLACAITVRKSIPAGGGLGGGSSDAASVLMGLDRVFGLGLGAGGLLPIALGLGSDLGYFIDEAAMDGATPPRPAVVSGFGERIERVDAVHAGTEVTLVLPPFGCATGAVYRAFDHEPGTARDLQRAAARVRVLAQSTLLSDDALSNDLYDAALAVEPGLASLCRVLHERLGLVAHLTGSGSTLFILGPVEASAVKEVLPECRLVRTRLV